MNRVFLLLALPSLGFLAGCGGSSPPASNATTVLKPVADTPPVIKPGTVRTKRMIPAYVTPYDLMTTEDEFYFHHLDNLTPGGDVAKWPLLKSLIGLGQNLVDAPMVARLANESIDISDQLRGAPILAMVKECAAALQVEPPKVHIQGSSEPNAYVAGLREPHTLVFTSGLLDLYEKRPEELRFIVGHELGHLKCKHLKTHLLGRALVGSIVGNRGESASFKEQFVAHAAVGTLLHWFRESEFSADRAGLLCVGGDLAVAKQALLRLIHQTKPDNSLFDPSHPDFDADLVLKNQFKLREEPFVKIMSHIRQSGATHPFIPDRCAALHQWSISSEYLAIVERQRPQFTNGKLIVKSVVIKQLPAVDTTVPYVSGNRANPDPYIQISHAGRSHKTLHGSNMTAVAWEKRDYEFDYSEGAGLIVEVYDHNGAMPDKFIGSCLVPVAASKSGGKHTQNIRLDVLENSTIVDLPTMTIEYALQKK